MYQNRYRFLLCLKLHKRSLSTLHIRRKNRIVHVLHRAVFLYFDHELGEGENVVEFAETFFAGAVVCAADEDLGELVLWGFGDFDVVVELGDAEHEKTRL